MPHNERHEELVALLALGAPLGEDAAELERHRAEGCAVCERLLAEGRDAAAALGASVPATRPPAGLRDRVMASLGPRRAPAPSMPWRVFAAAAALLLAAVVADDARLRREREELRSRSAELAGRLQNAETALAERALRARVLESEDVQMMHLGGTGPQPGARGMVCWSPKARRGVLIAGSLSALPPDRQYELWVFQNGKPVNAGVFDADPSGRAMFESMPFPEAEAQNFAVTVEPRGGMPAPTGPVVLVGAPA